MGFGFLKVYGGKRRERTCDSVHRACLLFPCPSQTRFSTPDTMWRCSDWAGFAWSTFFGVILKHIADVESFHLCIFQVHAQSLSFVWFFAVLWTEAHQAPLSMGYSRPEYWSGLLFPPPGDLPDPGIESTSRVSHALSYLESPSSLLSLLV